MQISFHNQSDSQKGGRKLVKKQRWASLVTGKSHPQDSIGRQEEALVSVFAEKGKNEGHFKS